MQIPYYVLLYMQIPACRPLKMVFVEDARKRLRAKLRTAIRLSAVSARGTPCMPPTLHIKRYMIRTFCI